MSDFLLSSIASSVVSAICIAIGYWLGQLRVSKFAEQVKVAESHIELCRRSLLEIKEEVGNLYQHLQTMDVESQKRQNKDLDEIARMMKNAVIGGEMPRPNSPLHPTVGSKIGAFRSSPVNAGA